MAVSVSILAVVTSLHLLAFFFAFGAERRRSTAVAVPDKYDEQTFCMYGTEAAMVYGMSAFGLLLVSQTVVNGVTKCLCCGKGLVTSTSSTAWAIVFFVVSWIGDHFVLVVDRLSTNSGLGTVNRVEPKAESVNKNETSNSLSAGTDICESKFLQCRIFHDEDSNMDTPCSCSGTLKFAHRNCVQRWCNEKGDIVWKICRQV